MGEQNSQKKFQSFSEFWPFYVREHRTPLTQYLHVFGTISGLMIFVYLLFLLVTWNWQVTHLGLFVLALVVGYGFAWFAHFFIEKNRPATFTYPLWSFYGDFKMAYYVLTGRMDDEVKKALQP